MRIWGKDMKNKFLISGSIFAVVVLVLAGLSPVVGFHSVRSSVKNSPLFNIRTSQAIGENTEVLTCDYLGRGQGSFLLFPERNNRQRLLHAFLEWLCTIDENEFNQFHQILIFRAQKIPELKEYSSQDIIDALWFARTHPDTVMNIVLDEEPTAQIFVCIFVIIYVYIVVMILTLYTLVWNLLTVVICDIIFDFSQ